MKDITLKYGCNPTQSPARVTMRSGADFPLQVLNGNPGYINFLDALNAWQLVSHLRRALDLPAAASFKHVSPAGAAVGLPLSDALKRICFVDDIPGIDDSPLACAYARARGADRLSSFGDFIALSDTCDAVTASVIGREASDGVIAPGYDAAALEILKKKRKGNYAVLRIDGDYVPDPVETRDVFGITLSQRYNDSLIDETLFQNIVTINKDLSSSARRDLIVALCTLKYTQSNSASFVKDGQGIGYGAGQQSRVHCTRLAGDKADLWHMRQHPKVLALPFRHDLGRPDRDNAVDTYLSQGARELLSNGFWQQMFSVRPSLITMQEKQDWMKNMKDISLGSDAFFPFSDNVERAHKSGVKFIAQPGGSRRDAQVIDACDRYGMVMAMTGMRLFHH